MSSKQVTDRQKNAASILAAQKAHIAPAVAEIEKTLTPHLQAGETMPDVALLVTLAGRMLEKATTDLVAADEAHEAELSDDAAPRQARDEVAAKLGALIVDTREWLRGFFGVSALRSLGFTGDTPNDPVQLERFAGQIIDALKKPLPPPRQKSATWDPAETIASLTTLRASLGTHLADVVREAREAQVTWAAKVSAMDGFEGGYRRNVGLFDEVLRFGGQDALADRLRPAVRRGSAAAGNGSEGGEADGGGEAEPGQAGPTG